MASGGAESTKNTMEQTNFGEIDWIREGAIQGAQELYPKRYNAVGLLNASCTTTAGVTSYDTGASPSDYETCVQAWKDSQTGSPLCVADATDESACSDTTKKTCYTGNNPALAPIIGAEADTLCSLVELEHGYSQW